MSEDSSYVLGTRDDDLYLYPWTMDELWDLLQKSHIYYYEYATGEPVEKVMESLVNAVETALKQGKIKPQ